MLRGGCDPRQVSGDAMLKGLKLALDAAPDVAAARPLLDGYMLAIRLAGVVSLDALCESFVTGTDLDTDSSSPVQHRDHVWPCRPLYGLKCT